MLDHLILYENFCSSSEFHSLCYFSACAISFFSHSARFFRLYFNLPSSFFYFSVSVHFSFLICALLNDCCRCSFHQVSSCVIFFFSLLFRFSFTRLLREEKKMIGACAAVFISRCISASRRLSFVRCELLINFFVPHSPIMIGLNSAVRIRMFSLYDMPSVASLSSSFIEYTVHFVCAYWHSTILSSFSATFFSLSHHFSRWFVPSFLTLLLLL